MVVGQAYKAVFHESSQDNTSRMGAQDFEIAPQDGIDTSRFRFAPALLGDGIVPVGARHPRTARTSLHSDREFDWRAGVVMVLGARRFQELGPLKNGPGRPPDSQKICFSGL